MPTVEQYTWILTTGRSRVTVLPCSTERDCDVYWSSVSHGEAGVEHGWVGGVDASRDRAGLGRRVGRRLNVRFPPRVGDLDDGARLARDVALDVHDVPARVDLVHLPGERADGDRLARASHLKAMHAASRRARERPACLKAVVDGHLVAHVPSHALAGPDAARVLQIQTGMDGGESIMVGDESSGKSSPGQNHMRHIDCRGRRSHLATAGRAHLAVGLGRTVRGVTSLNKKTGKQKTE